MKYFSANASVVTVRVRDGYWANSRQALFLARKLVWLFGWEAGSKDLYISSTAATAEHLISEFLRGSALADKALRVLVTAAEYRIVSEVASFLAADHEGSNAPDAYLAIDLNTGRNLVLRPR